MSASMIIASISSSVHTASNADTAARNSSRVSLPPAFESHAPNTSSVLVSCAVTERSRASIPAVGILHMQEVGTAAQYCTRRHSGESAAVVASVSAVLIPRSVCDTPYDPSGFFLNSFRGHARQHVYGVRPEPYLMNNSVANPYSHLVNKLIRVRVPVAVPILIVG